MSRQIQIRTYSPRTMATLEQTLKELFDGLWLDHYQEEIFRICDELIKNGVKSNYRTILYWLEARKRLIESNPDMLVSEADEWLKEVFYSGEDNLIATQIGKTDKHKILNNLVRILEMEAKYIDHRMGRREVADPSILQTLLRIKKFCRKHHIGVQLQITSDQDRINITITNDAPILNEDLNRIQTVRSTFREYQKQGNEEVFFIENINTEGGGHGLGYPLMDSILATMKLDPDSSLFLISASRTMILLSLPVNPPSS
ncbi:MAG: hypothetical protein H3C43_04525 [Leptonema sp. (in: Bacteria)]|nr:hypothetical protein [Leptonema sp. (in: bacteria)]